MVQTDTAIPAGYTTVAPWVVTDDTGVLAFDRRPEWPSMPSLLRVWVPDAGVAFARAVERGASVVTDLGDNAFGQRLARVKDPQGNLWWIVEQVETVPEEAIWQRLQQPEYSENMRYAQESLDIELSGSAVGRSSAPTRS